MSCLQGAAVRPRAPSGHLSLHLPSTRQREAAATCAAIRASAAALAWAQVWPGPRSPRGWTETSGMALSSGPVFCASDTEICTQQGEKKHLHKLEKLLNRLYSCQAGSGWVSGQRTATGSLSPLPPPPLKYKGTGYSTLYTPTPKINYIWGHFC